MEIKKLLYVTHLTEPAFDLFEGLLEIKKIGLQEIILMSDRLSQELKDRASEQGINLKEVTGSGPLIQRIFEVANREHASLIVAHLDREKRKSFRGSIATNLIKNTAFPILIIHGNGGGGSSRTKGLFNSVILATDWSDAARRAWLYIIGIKEIVGVLDLVYVLHERPTVREIRQLKERVEEIRKICLEEKMDTESHIYAGKTPEEIILASKDYNATMIVMGYKSKSAFKAIFSGSSCYEVIEKSSVPVLIIP
jgi:nucleotide-binding universal stress UspA family protein